MNRKHLLLVPLVMLTAAFGRCGGSDKIRNCPVIGHNGGADLYSLEFDLIVPADCPVPLAEPGTEKKYAAAKLTDLGEVDFAWVSTKVRNSSGQKVAEHVDPFFGRFAEPSAEYKAATGTSQFNDYDKVTFFAYSATGDKNATGETKITYQQSSLKTQLNGTSNPAPQSTHTWYAPTSGGYPGYMYQWYRDGNPVGNGSTYTGDVGTTDFDLRVEVTDQTWSTRAAVLMVDVGGVLTTINGPSHVYASQNGGTWTASGNGGTGSYTFNWYLEDQWVGSGNSWSGYPGQGSHTLQVRMTDSSGAFASQSIFVEGFGSGDGTCDPVPPQLTCDPT